MQLLCNEIVRQCLEQVNSETLFRFIDPAEVTSNVDDGVRLLKTTIDVCDSFKKMFRDYRDKASKVLSSDAWECKEETIFHRLNAFLERCHDILEVGCPCSLWTPACSLILTGCLLCRVSSPRLCKSSPSSLVSTSVAHVARR